MKIFKNRGIKRPKSSKFLEGLRKAVDYSKNVEKYKLKYFTILEKADDSELTIKARMRYRTLLENIEKAEKKIAENKNAENKNVIYDSNIVTASGGIDITTLRVAIEESKKNPNIRIDEKYYNQLESLRKPNKIKKWFHKIKLNVSENWELVKEFGREIQYWLIAEYKIFTKLSYALSRKKNEVKIRKAFKNNKSMFINKYGYTKGTKAFYNFAASINDGALMNKRLIKLGK